MGENMGQEELSLSASAIKTREARKKYKERGLCHCGGKLDSPLHFTCSKCRNRTKQARKKMRSEGRCIYCGDENENLGSSRCSSCLGKEKARYYIPGVKERATKRRRVRLLTGSNVKFRRLSKRPWPKDGACEMCGNTKWRISYHHWDDSKPSVGLWLCPHCHDIAEAVESKLEIKYLELKKEVETIEDIFGQTHALA
jgi:hypothetical protein